MGIVNQLTFEVNFEQVLLVELSSVVFDHCRTNSFPGWTDVRLEGVEGVGEGVDGVDDELDLRVLLVVRQVRHSEEKWFF